MPSEARKPSKIRTMAMLRITSARMLGHLRFHRGVLPLDELFNECLSDAVADVWDSLSSSSSLSSARANSGVCSVLLMDGVERADGERADFVDFVDLWEAGRELGVVDEAHGSSDESMVAARCRIG
jgi:hypothetical protein